MAIRKGNDAAKLANPERTSYASRRNLRSDGKGPWFRAQYGGECDSCYAPFGEGDDIRADGQGGWECREWCSDDE